VVLTALSVAVVAVVAHQLHRVTEAAAITAVVAVVAVKTAVVRKTTARAAIAITAVVAVVAHQTAVPPLLAELRGSVAMALMVLLIRMFPLLVLHRAAARVERKVEIRATVAAAWSALHTGNKNDEYAGTYQHAN
jgi:hypothetical protein